MTTQAELLTNLITEVQGLRSDMAQIASGQQAEPETVVQGVKKFAGLYPQLGGEASHRWHIHNRANNGLNDYQAITKRGKHWYINVPRYTAFLTGMPTTAVSISGEVALKPSSDADSVTETAQNCATNPKSTNKEAETTTSAVPASGIAETPKEYPLP
jgi:hypothetical protein